MNNILTHPITEALGWTLLHSLWIFSIIAIGYRLVVALPVAQKAQHNYVLSLSTLSMMFCAAACIFYWVYQPSIPTAEISLSEQIPLVEVDPNLVVKDIPQAFPEHITSSVPSISSSVIPWWERMWNKTQTHAKPYLQIMVMGWGIGIVLLMLRFIGGWNYLNRLRSLDTLQVDPRWKTQLATLADKMGIHRQVQVFISRRIHEPLTIGHFKPVILIPVGLLTQQPPEQVEAILLHELAHIRRYDFLFNVLQSWIEILFFYHPAVWWISQQTREAREHCCDDQAVSICQDPLLYAQALAQVQLNKVKGKHNPDLALSASGNKPSLTDRIYRIMGEPKKQLSPSRGTLVAVILMISGFIFAFQQVQQELDINENDSTVNKILEVTPETSVNEIREWIRNVSISDSLSVRIYIDDILDSINNQIKYFHQDTTQEWSQDLENLGREELRRRNSRDIQWKNMKGLVITNSGKNEIFIKGPQYDSTFSHLAFINDVKQKVYVLNRQIASIQYFSTENLKGGDINTVLEPDELDQDQSILSLSAQLQSLYQDTLTFETHSETSFEGLIAWKYTLHLRGINWDFRNTQWDHTTGKMVRLAGTCFKQNSNTISYDIYDRDTTLWKIPPQSDRIEFCDTKGKNFMTIVFRENDQIDVDSTDQVRAHIFANLQEPQNAKRLSTLRPINANNRSIDIANRNLNMREKGRQNSKGIGDPHISEQDSIVIRGNHLYKNTRKVNAVKVMGDALAVVNGDTMSASTYINEIFVKAPFDRGFIHVIEGEKLKSFRDRNPCFNDLGYDKAEQVMMVEFPTNTKSQVDGLSSQMNEYIYREQRVQERSFFFLNVADTSKLNFSYAHSEIKWSMDENNSSHTYDLEISYEDEVFRRIEEVCCDTTGSFQKISWWVYDVEEAITNYGFSGVSGLLIAHRNEIGLQFQKNSPYFNIERDFVVSPDFVEGVEHTDNKTYVYLNTPDPDVFSRNMGMTNLDITFGYKDELATIPRRGKPTSIAIVEKKRALSIYNRSGTTHLGVIAYGDSTQKGSINSTGIIKSFTIYPNPQQKDITQIEFELTESAPVKLSVMDVSGRVIARIVDNTLNKGFHSFEWDSSDLSSGTYIIILGTGGEMWTEKLIKN